MNKTKSAHKDAKIVDKAGPFRMVDCGVGTFAVAMSSNMSTWFNFGSQYWDCDPAYVGGVKCVPWGNNDDMPQMVRDLLEKNNIGPGILSRKQGLIYGDGPSLYKMEIVNNEFQQTWISDTKIQAWLESWDYKRYILDCLNEYIHLNGHFTKYVMGKAVRLGKAWVNSLECVPSQDCRLVWPDSDKMRLEDVKQILIGDTIRQRNLELYPIFDKYNPTQYESAMYYHNLRSFGRNLYSISSFFGSIPWMANANDIPEIVRALNDNMIAAAYIVHEPQGYWDAKRQQMEMDHPDWTPEHTSTEIENLRDQTTQKLAEVMAGKKNAGKFFTCVDFTDEYNHVQEWKVEPIEMNLDKYITAQNTISKLADSATTSGLGLSPALANIIIDGKSDSGSQMLYALKIFYGTDSKIPEDIVMEAINTAIHINFPTKKDVFLGLYHKVIQKEDNVSAGERAINNV